MPAEPWYPSPPPSWAIVGNVPYDGPHCLVVLDKVGSITPGPPDQRCSPTGQSKARVCFSRCCSRKAYSALCDVRQRRSAPLEPGLLFRTLSKSFVILLISSTSVRGAGSLTSSLSASLYVLSTSNLLAHSSLTATSVAFASTKVLWMWCMCCSSHRSKPSLSSAHGGSWHWSLNWLLVFGLFFLVFTHQVLSSSCILTSCCGHHIPGSHHRELSLVPLKHSSLGCLIPRLEVMKSVNSAAAMAE